MIVLIRKRWLGATDTPVIPQFLPEGNAEAVTHRLGMGTLGPMGIAYSVVYLLSEESEHIVGVNLAVRTGGP